VIPALNCLLNLSPDSNIYKYASKEMPMDMLYRTGRVATALFATALPFISVGCEAPDNQTKKGGNVATYTTISEYSIDRETQRLPPTFPDAFPDVYDPLEEEVHRFFRSAVREKRPPGNTLLSLLLDGRQAPSHSFSVRCSPGGVEASYLSGAKNFICMCVVECRDSSLSLGMTVFGRSESRRIYWV